MAGVGLTWYTWLEQGRPINVSAFVLDRVASVLQLDDVERRHLFLLAQNRPPVTRGEATQNVSEMTGVLLKDLKARPAYVFNLRWDVLAWNAAAQKVFDFESREPLERNVLWMLFSDSRLHGRIVDWRDQAPLFVASFRRDFAQALDNTSMLELVGTLETISPLFKELWHSQSVHGRCQGKRMIEVDPVGPVEFNHSTLIVDPDQHLRLAFYAVTDRHLDEILFADI